MEPREGVANLEMDGPGGYLGQDHGAGYHQAGRMRIFLKGVIPRQENAGSGASKIAPRAATLIRRS